MSTNAESGDVSVIDTPTNAVVGPIPVGKAPGNGDHPGRQVRLRRQQPPKSVSVIDTETTRRGRADHGRHAPAIAITPDGKRAYIANTRATSL